MEFSIVLSILKYLSQISFPNHHTSINFMTWLGIELPISRKFQHCTTEVG
jgi:hypothetical protein